MAYIVGCDSKQHLLQRPLYDQAAWNLASSVQMMSACPAMRNKTIPLQEITEQVVNYTLNFNLYLFSQK